MTFTDEQKLKFAKSYFVEKLFSVKTWPDFKSLVSTITKTQVKTFLKNALQEEADRRKQLATDETTTATDLETLKDEINSI